MTLIKSISGIRGTIGGAPGSALTPIDIVKFTYAYAATLPGRKPSPNGARYKIVVGKDARLSGDMVESLVVGTLVSCGIDVVRCGFASTPTTEMAVLFTEADGGIILTASHNPRQWNALKLLNDKGEFLTAAEGQAVLDLAEKGDFSFAEVDDLGTVTDEDFTDAHLDAVLAMEAVDVEAVRAAHFTVVVDAVNSVGGIIMPRLLKRLGVKCIELNCNPTGDFAHNPEPLPANLKDLRAISPTIPSRCRRTSRNSARRSSARGPTWASASIPTWTASPSSARTASLSSRSTPSSALQIIFARGLPRRGRR